MKHLYHSRVSHLVRWGTLKLLIIMYLSYWYILILINLFNKGIILVVIVIVITVIIVIARIRIMTIAIITLIVIAMVKMMISHWGLYRAIIDYKNMNNINHNSINTNNNHIHTLQILHQQTFIQKHLLLIHWHINWWIVRK